MSDHERSLSGDDEEHLAKIIVDSIREAEKYREEEGPLSPEAFRALDQADLAAEKLSERLWRLRGELDAIVAPGKTELNSAVLRPYLGRGQAAQAVQDST